MSPKVISKLPIPGHSSESGSFRMVGKDLSIDFVVKEGGRTQSGKIIFTKVVAIKFSDEGHTGHYDPIGYDAIAEYEQSDWVMELSSIEPWAKRWPFKRRHFITFLRNIGSFDVVADDCIIKPLESMP